MTTFFYVLPISYIVCLLIYIILDFVSNWELFDMYIKEVLMNKYSNTMNNLKELEEQRCTVLHDVDAYTMNRHPLLHSNLFDRIVFNFPPAGFIWPEHDKRQIK